jgi:hypothetical protein
MAQTFGSPGPGRAIKIIRKAFKGVLVEMVFTLPLRR